MCHFGSSIMELQKIMAYKIPPGMQGSISSPRSKYFGTLAEVSYMYDFTTVSFPV